MRRMSLAALFVALVCLACRHGAYYTQSKVMRVCGPTPGNPPIVCINPVTLQPIPGHEQPRASRGMRQWVQFFFATGNDDLQIQCDVLENIDHDGRGHAWGRVKSDAMYGEHPYTV